MALNSEIASSTRGDADSNAHRKLTREERVAVCRKSNVLLMADVREMRRFLLEALEERRWIEETVDAQRRCFPSTFH